MDAGITCIPCIPSIQEVRLPSGGSVLAILWISELGVRVGAYVADPSRAVCQLTCKDEKDPPVASSVGIGPSFQMVQRLNDVLNDARFLSTPDACGEPKSQQLVEVCRAWLTGLKAHWRKFGYHTDWLDTCDFSQSGHKAITGLHVNEHHVPR
jgi:hypothetical protein